MKDKNLIISITLLVLFVIFRFPLNLAIVNMYLYINTELHSFNIPPQLIHNATFGTICIISLIQTTISVCCFEMYMRKRNGRLAIMDGTNEVQMHYQTGIVMTALGAYLILNIKTSYHLVEVLLHMN